MRTKVIMILLVASAMVAGCKKTEEAPPVASESEAKAPAPTPPPLPTAMSAEELGNRYAECWRLFNGHSWDDFVGCFSENMRYTTEGVPGEQNRAEQVAGAKAFTNAFPDGKGETQFTLVNGRRVVGVTQFTGTHSGLLVDPKGDIPATGKPVGYLIALDVAFDDHNQISSMHETFDMGSFMFQLGLSPGPGRPVGGQVGPAGTAIATGDEVEASNVEAHKKAYDHFNARDPAFNDVMADDIVESANGDPADVVGKANLIAKNAMMLKGFSDMKVAVDEAWGAGDYTVVRGHMRGTNDGELAEMGLTKTGKAVDMGILEIIRWDAGKAKHAWTFMNTMEMAEQLGLMAGPEETTAPE